jgi:serine/threonine protein phosphatase PrpC
MTLQIRWHCRQGTRTAVNRDHAGIGIRGDAVLAIVLDGSTSGSASGDFAREIARRMVDWFVTGTEEVTADALIAQLRMTHAVLAMDFRTDSASYVLVHIEATRPALVLHAGDCLVGRHEEDGRIAWLLQPHTLANPLLPVASESLAKDSARHRLTRSFRSKRFIAPDLNSFELDDRPLLVATDGFWAELEAHQQVAFIEGLGGAVDEERDDCGALSILRGQSGPGIELIDAEAAPNLYHSGGAANRRWRDRTGRQRHLRRVDFLLQRTLACCHTKLWGETRPKQSPRHDKAPCPSPPAD